MGAERLTLEERRRLIDERLGQPVADDHSAERRVPARHPLGEGDHVRLVSVAGAAVHVPEATEGGDHLVAHEQHAVPIADLAHPLEVAVRRHERATRVLHRLHEHRGDGLRAFHLDPQRHVVGAPQRAGVEMRAVDAPEPVGRLDLDEARQQWFERRLDRRHAGHAQRPHRGAVIGERS